MGSAEVEQCIVDEVASWVFDSPDGGEVDVVFPFIFGHAPSVACPAAPVAGP